MFYMLCTRERLFFEPYHLGRSKADPPCSGGFVPTSVFDHSSSMYHRAIAHFDYVWNSTQEFARGTDTKRTKGDGHFLITRTLEEVEEATRRFHELNSRKGLAQQDDE